MYVCTLLRIENGVGKRILVLGVSSRDMDEVLTYICVCVCVCVCVCRRQCMSLPNQLSNERLHLCPPMHLFVSVFLCVSFSAFCVCPPVHFVCVLQCSL